jgi:Tfp pilus tip-associated adhesin PilY1
VINTEIAANAAKVIMDDAEIAANAAKVIMDDAKTAADDAKTIMDDAETAANDTKTVMDDAETAANDAKTVMDDAETAANDAKTVMDDAETAAEDAETVMDDAETNADAAVIAKDDAYNTAYNTAYNIAILAGDTPADADIAATGAALADVDYINASALSDTATITHNNAITASDSANSDLVAATTASGLADTAFTNATTAFGLADTAFTDATTASGLADTAFTDATTASGLADTAFTDATTASGLADTAFNDAATAFGIADAAYNDAETASDQADIAYLDAEAAVVLANAAFTAATSVSGLADTAFTDATTASGTANANLDVANAEYDAAEEARDLASAAWNLENDAYLLLEFARGEAYDAHLAAKGIYDTKQTQFITDDAALTAAEAALSDASNAVVDILYFNYMELSGIEADKTVRWIRGEAGITDYRSREFDWYNDGTTQTWRLGDIIHSTPVVVASPRDRHDIVNGDETYAAYVDQYYNRRHVVYVGANDGMLHAFNAGFWNDKNKEFDTDNGFANSGTSSVTSHPLGSELWAYVPKAVLPHLQWLTSPSYAHTYYVDGEAETYDVNIFADDATHPNGWGTILVVPMRFGGGEFSVDTDNDGIDDEVLRSSISIFDITDPEVAPNLLAEISNPELGFTTSKPTLVKARLPATNGLFATPSAERWLLAFGSGPNVLDTATSTETAKLFLYDLETLSLVSGYAPLDLVDANSYVGSISSVDWNADYVDDALYFGVNSGLDEKDSESAITETGRLARVRFSSNDLENFNEDTWLSTRLGADASGAATLINTERTMLGAPITMQDDNGRHWIYGGTGRLLVAADNASDKQQRYYGVMEPVDGNNEEELTPVNASTLEDVTNIRVFTNGEVDRSGSTFQIPSGTDIANFSQFENAISAEKLGWYHDLTYNGADKPSGRNINGSTRFKSLIFYTEYVPSGDECIPEGESELHAVHYKTGTATPFDVIGTDATTTKDTSGTNEGELVLAGLELGKGLASAPTVIVNNAGTSSNSAGTLAIQLGTGELKLINFGESGSKGGRESWREIEMDGMDL